jgi:ergothioneine biosynthesis protein EgtB
MSLPDLAKRYADIRAATLALAAPLSESDCSVQSMPDASPVKWHLAHTTWFFETFVVERFAGPEGGFEPFDPSFRVLFNSYYNSVGEQYPRPQRGLITRPGLAQVERYRACIDERIASLLTSASVPEGLAELVELGLQHEQQHQELVLTDLKHALSFNPNEPAYRSPVEGEGEGEGVAPLEWRGFEEGLVEIGYSGSGFSFDNERPRHRVFLEAFELASRPVSNGEWRAFIDDDGYRRPELWLSDGWAALQAEQWQAPLYWRPRDGAPGQWWSFTLGGRQPVRDEEPVCHVSYYEADAFATWAGARLPRESEWEVAARALPIEGNFVESGRLHPSQGPGGFFGNVWEWTASPYTAYPRYCPPAGALGEYNGKFMADQWVLRGGSCATPRSHVRASYRNFFPAGARWQFSGLRLARDPA